MNGYHPKPGMFPWTKPSWRFHWTMNLAVFGLLTKEKSTNQKTWYERSCAYKVQLPLYKSDFKLNSWFNSFLSNYRNHFTRSNYYTNRITNCFPFSSGQIFAGLPHIPKSTERAAVLVHNHWCQPIGTCFSRWWFHFCLFSPLFGEDFQFD